MIDVAEDNGEQAEKKHHRRGVDDRVEGLDARREELHAAEVLHRTRKDKC